MFFGLQAVLFKRVLRSAGTGGVIYLCSLVCRQCYLSVFRSAGTGGGVYLCSLVCRQCYLSVFWSADTGGVT